MQRTAADMEVEFEKKSSVVGRVMSQGAYEDNSIYLVAAIMLVTDQLREINQRLSEIDNSVDNITRTLKDI
jgi:hypothetical protein